MRVILRAARRFKESLRRSPIIKIPAIPVNEILFRHRRRRRRRVRIGSIRRPRQRLASDTIAIAIQTMRVNAGAARPLKERLRRRPIIKIPAIPVNKIPFRHRRSRRRRSWRRGRRSSIGAIARRPGQPLASNAIAVMVQGMRIHPGAARRLKKRLRRRPIPKIPAIPVNEIAFRCIGVMVGVIVGVGVGVAAAGGVEVASAASSGAPGNDGQAMPSPSRSSP